VATQRFSCSVIVTISVVILLPLLSSSSPVLDALFVMSLSPVTIPQISISPAPPQDPVIEPYSPFASIKYPDYSDAFRPRLLTPPPSSPLRSCSSPGEEDFDLNEGLDSQRFQALLQATRERNARKQNDLRREVTLRAHRSKQSKYSIQQMRRKIECRYSGTPSPIYHQGPSATYKRSYQFPSFPSCSSSFFGCYLNFR
jgi:hypothetical protein